MTEYDGKKNATATGLHVRMAELANTSRSNSAKHKPALQKNAAIIF